jgi:lipid-A-disaccharide synthase
VDADCEAAQGHRTPKRPATDPGLSVAMVAGEPSGDLLAGLLLDGLQRHWPGLKAVGIGGPQMARRGFEAWWSSDRLAVRGYAEVLRHYRAIVSIRAQLQRRLLSEPPDVFVGVDAPDFNLPLERALKAGGVTTVHFVCPSVWAWRAERIHTLAQSADLVLCVFPFEIPLLERHGIRARYVGHPLAQVIPFEPDRVAARRRLQLPVDEPVVAVLPGSRGAEVEHLAPRFFRTAALLAQARPAMRFVVPSVPAWRARVGELARRYAPGLHLEIPEGHSHDALEACDVALIASGTATLEAALYKRPMVIAYHMNELSWQITRRKMLQPWVGLPNILCGSFVVPEFLQRQAQPARLAAAVLEWFEAPSRVAALERRFTELHHELRRDTPEQAAHAIEELLGR